MSTLSPPGTNGIIDFNHRDKAAIATISLKADDGTVFRVDGHILASWSGYFREVLSCPDALSVLHLKENATVISDILSLITGAKSPQFSTIGELDACLQAAIKYDVRALLPNLALSLSQFTEDDPLRVYSLAYNAGFPTQMRTAATESLKLNIVCGHHDEVLSQLYPKARAALLQLHTERVRRFKSILPSLQGIVPCEECPGEQRLALESVHACLLASMQARPFGDTILRDLRQHLQTEHPSFTPGKTIQAMLRVRCLSEWGRLNHPVVGFAILEEHIQGILSQLPLTIERRSAVQTPL